MIGGRAGLPIHRKSSALHGDPALWPCMVAATAAALG